MKRKKDIDKTDPFLKVEVHEAHQAEEIIYDEDCGRLSRFRLGERSFVKWLAGKALTLKQNELEKRLNYALNLLPGVEELLLDEIGFIAEDFDSKLINALQEISLADMLAILKFTVELEEKLFAQASLGFESLDINKLFLKDVNPTGIKGHKKSALRFYSLENLVEVQAKSYELVRIISEFFAKEVERRISEAKAFGDNYQVCEEVFEDCYENPEKAGELLSNLRCTFEIAKLTHVGKVRKNNEDSLLVETSSILGAGKSFSLLAVADGMGGHNAGEVASALSLEVLRCYSPFWVLSSGLEDGRMRKLTEVMAQHIRFVNEEVTTISQKVPELYDMGTTLTGIFLCYDGDMEAGVPLFDIDAFVFNVGDSRTFKVGFGGYAPLTKDHSLVQELVDLGKISDEEAFHHPQKNIVSQAIGTGNDIKPDVFELRIPLDSFLLIASDGLTDLVHPSVLAEITQTCETAQELASAYFSTALEAGGSDNVTIIAIKPRITL